MIENSFFSFDSDFAANSLGPELNLDILLNFYTGYP